MILWRIATETRRYAADDSSGSGAAQSTGRWNEHGQLVLYLAPTISIAVLETAAHMDDGGLPLNRYLVSFDVPPNVWRKRRSIGLAALPPTWNAVPAGAASARVGSEWLKSQASAVLVVPSVIVPEETVALINPLHADAVNIKASVVRPFEYSRLFRAR